MRYSLIHFLRHFPWKYYLTGGLFRLNEPVVAVFLSPGQSSPALVARGRHAFWYEANVAAVPDAPPWPEPAPEPGGSSGRSFSDKLLARCRLKSPACYVLLPEFSVNDFYCNVHRVDSLRENAVEILLENLQEDPRQVFGAWDDPRPFRWAVLSTELKPLRGSLERHDAEVMIVGAPAEYCDRVEGWIDRQQASLAAIMPPVLACLRWFLEALAPPEEPCVLVLEFAATAVVAVLMNRRVVLVRQYAGEVDDVGEELSERVRDFAVGPGRIYRWGLGGRRLVPLKRFNAVEVTPEIMREIHGGGVAYRRPGGASLETEDPAAYLLHWVTQNVL